MAGKTTPAALHQELIQIRKMLEQFTQEESATKQAFSTLYTELEQYKKEFLFQAEKGLLQDLLLFYDSLIWFQSSIQNEAENREENLEYLIAEFLEVLRRKDVTPFPPRTEFDPKFHKIVQISPVEDIEQDQMIDRVLKKGFYRGENVLRAEEVILNKHEPSSILFSEYPYFRIT